MTDAMKDAIHINFPSVLKHSRPVRQLKPHILKRYLADTKIFPVEVLHTYLKATLEIRKSKTKLLISFLKPHNCKYNMEVDRNLFKRSRY